MIITEENPPGLYFSAQPPPSEPLPLRTDVAGFIGNTRRGPIGKPVRIEGWRHYLFVFGGLTSDMHTPYAIRGYFENGGQVAYVYRWGNKKEDCKEDKFAKGSWNIGQFDSLLGIWDADAPSGAGFNSSDYQLIATSPGDWAYGLKVKFRYRLRGRDGKPEVDLIVEVLGEPTEYWSGLRPDKIEKEVEERSNLIRLKPTGSQIPSSLILGSSTGPVTKSWEVILDNPNPISSISPGDCLVAIDALSKEPEVSLLAVPELYKTFSENQGREQLIKALVTQGEETHDRLILLDVPGDIEGTPAVLEWVGRLRSNLGYPSRRSVAVYYPWLKAPDFLDEKGSGLREIPAAGHIAGVISRLDRERGSHYTPANAPVFQAMDISKQINTNDQAILMSHGINLTRCIPGNGLQLWGGRTLAEKNSDPTGIFIAHRRLIHRLIRVIRRVAQPINFDNNGPELWLKIVRGITTMLLAAYRAGALKGSHPNEAFNVKCDETLNIIEERDLGRVFCEIQISPAVPMEFITLRIALSSDGRMEVQEP